MVNRLEQEIPGYHGGIRIVRRGTEVLADVLTKNSFSSGTVENIGEADRLHNQGMDTTIWSAHESDYDRPGIGMAIRKAGFPEFSDNIVTKMGVRVLAKPFRGFVARAHPHIPFPQDKTGDWRTLLKQAKVSVPKLLHKGKVILAFPGGTRSKTGILIETNPLMGHFLTENGVVLPMTIAGARDAWPVEGRPRPFSEVVFKAGKPIIIREIIEEIDFEEKHLGRRLKTSERNAILVDAVTRRGIAPLVDVDKRGPYKHLNLSIADVLIICDKREKVVV